MKIRLEGTRDEVDTAAQALVLGFEVQEVSDFYANNRRNASSMLGRVYVTATVLPAHIVRARATRLDTTAARLDTDPPPQLTS